MKNLTTHLKRLTVFAVALFAAITAGFFVASSTSSAQSCNYQGGSVDCNGWDFDYFLASGSVNPTGLTLTDGSFDGDSMFSQVNFASLPVKYDNNACGPYVDLFSTVTNSQPTGIQSDVFTQNGEQWLELGAHYQIGSYILYTAYYFGENGDMEMRIFARGLQCNVHHEHYPMFVMDLDVEGVASSAGYHDGGDEIYYELDGVWTQQTEERDNLASQLGHNWVVRDDDSGKTVEVRYDSGAFAPPTGNTYAPVGALKNKIYTREGGSDDELAWKAARPGLAFNSGQSAFNNGEWSYNNNQTITDPVIVVRGFLDHDVAGNLPDDWHTAGIAMRFVPDPLLPVAPTSTPTAVPTATPVATPTTVPGTGPDQLVNGTTVTGLSGAAESEQVFVIDVPADADLLEVVMFGGPDADLYTRVGEAPSQELWDCRPYIDGTSEEVCTIADPAAGEHFVMVRGWTAFQNVSLTATHSTVTEPPGGSVLQDGIPVSGLAGAAGTELNYTFEVPATATSYMIDMVGQGDADLYVRMGAAPTTDLWDCRPYNDETSVESCTMPVPPSGTVHVMVRGYRAFSGLNLTANWEGGTAPPAGGTLTSGIPVTGLAGAPGSEQFFTIDVPAGTSELVVAMSGNGDADLYTNAGSAPTLTVWDCRPYVDVSSNETCTISNPAAGTHHIMIRGYAAFSAVTLTANLE